MPSIVAELSKAKQAALKKHNQSYADELKMMMRDLPGIAVKAAIKGVYPVVVEETIQDSGLAAYNWWIAVGQSKARRYVKRKGTGPTTKQTISRWKRKGVIAEPFRRSAVVMNKLNYMRRILELPAYRGNAKIRIAVEKGLMEAGRAVDAEMKRYR